MKQHRNSKILFSAAVLTLVSGSAIMGAAIAMDSVSDDVIASQRAQLAKATAGSGFGPQSPRDIEVLEGNNPRKFLTAPDYTKMNLCDIHFHRGTEHKGGEFTKPAGNGNGEGIGTGFLYNGSLTVAELAPVDLEIGAQENGSLIPGDTIEVHYVYTTATVTPAPTLASCFNDASVNPQLRVQAQVFVLVNDDNALDFMKLTDLSVQGGYQQAPGILTDTGDFVQYIGSTTGPGYNESGSPYEVTWGVRPKVAKVNIKTVATWFNDNVFQEKHAHGVRNLVKNPALLSKISD